MQGALIKKKIKTKIAYAGEYVRYYSAHPGFLVKQKFELFTLWARKYTGGDPNFNDAISSDLPIDVVIPTIEKDLAVVTHVIDSIRTHLRHPIGDIIIISPESKKIRDMCAEKGCRFIEENTVLPIRKSDIDFTAGGLDRSGWVFQQLLKWGADTFATNDHFLITESDTIFIRPRIFKIAQKTIMPCSSDRPHLPYFAAYEKLLGETVPPIFDFTSHHSLFNKAHLAELKKRIEEHSGKPWYQAIIDVACRDKNEISPVSDYETYGQFVNKHFPREVVREYWFNLSLGRKELGNLKELAARYAKKYKAISFHSYND